VGALTVRALKAKHGDSLLLLTEDSTILIDGGTSGVYKQALREVLLELAPVEDEPAQIDLLMVSHIDADHIDGILDLTAELIEDRDEERESIVRINSAWHNSFSDIIAQENNERSSAVKAQAASLVGRLIN